MDFKGYIKNRIPDYLICIGAALGLSENVFSSFVMTDSFSESIPITLAVIMIASAVLFLVAYNKKTTVTFIILFMICAIIGIIYLQRYNPFMGEGYDDSIILFWIITVLSTLAVFALSRTRAGCIVLFAAGHIIMAAFDFLEYPVVIWAYVLFLLSAFLAYFNRVYYTAVLKSDYGKISFKSNFIQTALTCITVLAIAGGIYAFVIKPLDPPTDEIKLVTKFMSFEILEKVGISSELEQSDLQRIANLLSDETKYSNTRNSNSTAPTEENNKSKEENEQEEGGADENEKDPEKTQDAEAIRYDQNKYLSYLLICIGVILILILPFILKKLQRNRWYKKVSAMDNEHGSLMVYSDILRKFKISGHKKPDNLTLLEFSKNNEKIFENFNVLEINFKKLTEIFIGVLYGETKITKEEFDDFLIFHKSLNKNIKKDLGFVKYAVKYFMI